MERPLGPPVEGFVPPPAPGPALIEGRTVRLERLDPDRHAAPILAAMAGADRVWDYLGYGPFAAEGDHRAWAERMAAGSDPCFYAFVGARTGLAQGLGSFMRIIPNHGVIEIGHIWLGDALQRTPAATEAMFLLFRHVLDELGYRRLEWKCDAGNAASRRAAERFGFTFEGIFRQHMIVKGRNRDTAWFSLLDHEWPGIRAGFERWLAPGNFTADGRQIETLAACRTAG